MNIRFFALGGIDENGKNCYVFEFENELFIVNYGTKVPINYSLGIDTLIPDFTYLKEQRKRIKGIFISDIQNDSLSGLPWLLMEIPEIPIYCSFFSKQPILERLEKYNIKNVKINVVWPYKPIEFNQIVVCGIDLAGALPGTLGFAFITKNAEKNTFLFLTNCVDGDLGIYGKTDFNKIKHNFDNIVGLFLDCGMSNYNDKSCNKIDIKNNLRQIFKKTSPDQRIIIGAYDQEMSTTQQILDLALEFNRKVITYGRSYSQLLKLLVKINKDKIKLPQIADYKLLENKKIDWNNSIIIVTGTVERLFKRFIRIAQNNDIYLKIKNNDVCIFIAPPINGLETESAFALDELARKTPHIYDISDDNFYRCRTTKQDIIDCVRILKPKYFIPIQGLFRYLTVAIKEVTNKNLITQNNCILMSNGKILKFKNNELISQKERLSKVGDIIIDGFGIGDISNEVIFERENLAHDGVVIASIMINKKTKELYDNIDIKYIGVISSVDRPKASELVKSIIEEVYFKELNNQNEKLDLSTIQNQLKKTIRKKIFKFFDKEPMIVISFNEI